MGEHSHRKAAYAPRMIAKAAFITVRGLWLAALLAMCAWLLFAGTPFGRYNTSFYSNISFLVVVPALLATSSLGVVVLQPLCGQQHAHSGSCSRLAAHLLPPRRFWQQVIGGLTLLDLAVLCFLAAVNIIWACALLTNNWRLLMPTTAMLPPTSAMILKMIAESCGALLAPNLVLLLYPITRGSVVLQSLRLSYPEAIRYHRWVGHYTMLLVLLHCILYYGAWSYEGIFNAKAFEQGSKANGLFGGMAFLLSMVMWVACAQAIRRKAFEVFKALHHVGFYSFLVLGCCHYWQMIWWCLPGLVLYFMEGAVRIWQSCGSRSSVRVLHAFVSTNGQLCSLVLSAPDYAVASSGVVWLSAPGISWFGTWHPFDYIAVPWTAEVTLPGDDHLSKTNVAAASSQTAMLITMKAFDGWTEKFITRVAEQGVNISVKMQGPYADIGGPADGYSCGRLSQAAGSSAKKQGSKEASGAIIVAGGTSITPAMAVLQELAAGSSASTLPVLLIWSLRHAAELELLCPPLLAMAVALKLHLTTQLYYTGYLPDIKSRHAGCKLQQQQQQQQQQLAADSLAGGSVANAAATVQDIAFHSDQAVLHIVTDSVDTSSSGSSSDDEDSATADCFLSMPTAATAVAASSPMTSIKPILQPANSNDSNNSSIDCHAKAVAPASRPCLSVSPLCPVVSLDSYSSQACMKLLLHVAAHAGVLCAMLLGQYIIVGSRPELLPTNRAGALMNVLVATAVLLPATLVTALGLFIKSRRRRMCSNHRNGGIARSVSCTLGGNADGQIAAAAMNPESDVAAALAAAAAAAADAVRHGSCGRLQVGKRGVDLQLELLALQRGAATASSSSSIMPVTAGRPQLQPLVEGWLAMLRQLPQADDSPDGPHKGSRKQQTESEGELFCTLYAMGPAALVADAQVLCGGIKGVHFVQKTHQL